MQTDISPEALKRLIDRSPVALSLCAPSLHDCPLVYINDAFLQLTGYRREEVIGRNCRLLQGPQSEDDARNRLRVAVDGRRQAGIAITNYRRNGEIFRNFVFLHPLLDAGGAVRFILGSQYELAPVPARARSLTEHASLLDRDLERTRPVIAAEADLLVAAEVPSIALAQRYLRDDDND